jgi:hypothetical protein
VGDQGRAGQGRSSSGGGPDRGQNAGRAPGLDDLGERLKRVFGIDIETCSVCGGAMRIIACIEDPAVIEKILAHLDAKAAAAQASRPPPSRAPPVLG